MVALRALGHALAGREAEADADWARHRRLIPDSSDPEIGRGWLALRRGDAAGAAGAFETIAPAKRRAAMVLRVLSVARLRQGDAAGALHALKQVPARDHDALSLTYLAEAWLGINQPRNAIDAATDAIDEADSTHGRSWLVRAEAYRAVGEIESAAEDYNRAIWAADEPGTEAQAMAGLSAIDRPVSHDEPE
jgi:tetratricopeptide (TPR) repeat protein